TRMNRRAIRRIGGFLLLWVIAMAVIFCLLPDEFRRSYALGYAIACALAIFAISTVHQHILPQLRKMPLYVAVAVTSLLYMGAIVIASAIGIFLLLRLTARTPAESEMRFIRFFDRGWEVTLGAPFLVALGILFMSELSRRIGPKRLASLLLGRYRNPREEIRIFLLIDLSGSTPLAERLGSVRYSTFLQDFFDQLTEPVIDTGGEIVEYVGDEAIVSWRKRPGRSDDALRCYLQFRQRVHDHEAEFRAAFGEVPRFKAALHAGPIVATEIGQIKAQVVLHGDALNTAARVLAECNALSAELLVTEAVASDLSPTPDLGLEWVGKTSLRGKWDQVGLLRLARRDESPAEPPMAAEALTPARHPE
ncbi:MAG TPA: adenylate/guanylate cyclase domain-containing protein, partial [Fimbriimonadaceae bacterium]|nr:adenylate/guanylate cyclase domain-containing protein [Fimbriimonadaceae bacterium]